MTPRWHVEVVQRADAAFFDALLDGDVTDLEALLAQEFLIVDVASGSVHDRAAFLEAISTGAVTFEEIETFPGETVFRPVGEGAGIVVGRTAMSFSDPEGRLTEVSSRWTYVFEADDSGWQLVSAQGTRIPSNAVAR